MLEQIYEVETVKWDKLAKQNLADLQPLNPKDNFAQYAQQTSTMVGVTDFLGDLDGKHVLEYGCGLGTISVCLAASGAKLTSFDLSAASVTVTRRRTDLNDLADNINLVVAGGEWLPFADESFDVVFGKAILHHLQVELGQCELYRVLKPGGKAAFVEPMGMNPLLNFVRDHVHYPGKNPRGADKPLNYDEIHAWGRRFKKFHYREIQLFSMLERGLGFKKRLDLLRNCDNFVLKHFSFLRSQCRYVVMFMKK